MTSISLRISSVLMAALFAFSSGHAQVRLNEIGASSSERLLTRNSNGVAHLGGGPQWWDLQFDTTDWKSGRGPIGFGHSGLATDVRAEVHRRTPTLYVRQEFQATAAEAASTASLSLRVDYDDAFIAYLNGVEVARANAGATHGYLYADQVAYQPRSGNGVDLSLGPSNQFLLPGDNVFAVEVHNESLDSSNLKLDATLGVPGTAFIARGAPCAWFPGIISPSGGVSDPSMAAPEFEDWIEVHNAGPLEVDLSGWGLSDEVGTPLKWTFPADTFLGPGGHLLVIADGREELNGTTTYLHCGFKLSADGEALSLSDATGTIQSEIPGGFPPQYPTHSYGWDSGSATFGYFENPTPGTANTGPILSDRADAPDFDQKGGFYDSTVTLTLTSSTPGATIRYTLDGSQPTETNGTIYTDPLVLTAIDESTGRVVRARAFKDGMIPSKSKSHTYLIDQAFQIRSIPALIFTGDENEIFYKPHGIMSIEGGTYAGNQWQPNGSDSYNIPINRGIQYERPVRLEFYHADGTPGFRKDAGVRLAASSYSRPRLRLDNPQSSPWPSSPVQKPSFNLYFRNDYGEPSLDYPWLGETYPATSFEQLRVRAGKNDIRNPWIRDEIMRRLYSDMGQASSVGITNTLYINGSFKGFFNMTERLREPFMQAHHGGNEEWDVRQVGDFPNGDATVWNRMMARLNGDLAVLANWQAAEAYLDPVNMADYFLLNIYGTTWDWPQNNWVGARERTAEGRFRLYIWDAEGSFGHSNNHSPTRDTISVDLLNKNNPLSDLFKRLRASPEWRLIFADRVHKHFFNRGVLDDRRNDSFMRWRTFQLRREFQPILNFVHGETPNTQFYFTWTAPNTGRRAYLLGPTRTYLADHGLWPATAPPTYNQHGGEVASGFELTMSAETGSVIHYTLDGSDPRQPGGAVNPTSSLYESPVALNASRITVKSRSYEAATASWSALTEAEFVSGLAVPESSSLVISELMYHPADASGSEVAAGFTNQDNFEFVELKNVSESELDLGEVAFTAGISFSFAGSDITTLLPGGRVLIVANLTAFRQRYGTAMDNRIAGEFSGNLSNREDTVTVSLAGDPVVTLHSLHYLDVDPWPDCADGPGHSLLLASPDTAPDHSDPASWLCSPHFGGELGGDGPVFDYERWVDFTFDSAGAGDPAVSGALANPDGDDLNNFGEFALGSDPLVQDSGGRLPLVQRVQIGDSSYLVMEFRRSRFQLPVSYRLQASSSLTDWTDVLPAEIEAADPAVESDGTIRESWRFLEPTGLSITRFLRLVAEPSLP